ncbi:hypothetical protein ANN_00870 [Periplaneta americana]|uniref:Long-chain-fatty-acid--CoA ligase n=1 Tax=Periplaneta americana TaxID=6978 RepID=A0ABQ8TRZ3_PERAM|nr:hypothetical protein ANN_00870 [Periplaneta americana]
MVFSLSVWAKCDITRNYELQISQIRNITIIELFQVDEYSNKIANVFKDHGFRKGDTVGLLMENRPEYVCIWLGLAKLGVITPLINFNLRLNPLVHSITIGKCQALIFSSEITDAIKDVASNLPSNIVLYRWSPVSNNETVGLGEKNLTTLISEAPSTPPVVNEKVGYNDRLLYIYTSGTTGLPKAAVITHARYSFMSLGIYYIPALKDDDIVYCPLPLYHSGGGALGVGQAIVSGITVVIRRKFSASQYIPECVRHNCTVHFPVVPQAHSTNCSALTHDLREEGGWSEFINSVERLRSSIFIVGGLTRVIGFKPSDRFYVTLPLYHTAGGIGSIGQALFFGSSVVIRKKFSASAYMSDIRKYECTVGQYIGEMCRYILAVPPKPEDKQHKLRLIYGNGLRPQIWTKFVERFNIPRVAEFYGATEGNANIVNIDNKVGAIGFVSRILPVVYPISIIKVEPETGEPIRNGKGLCTVCKPGEPGVFVGKINPNNPSRAFLGYVNEKESQKKIVYDVFSKGDSAFISGDLLVSDEFGYLYFKDRTGDTFRWKGENVSTSEVEAVISNLIDYRDAVVYGVEVRGMEGRAGMAAIVDQDDTLDLKTLAEGVTKALPSYARPQFIRIMRKVDLTGTFKLKKRDLQQDGFDPVTIKDKLYFMSSSASYETLTEEIYNNIFTGKIRL